MVWTMGMNPSIANPAATPTIVCSMMPTLTARSGWECRARPNWSVLISASTTATRGSSSNRSAVVSPACSRMERALTTRPPARRR